MASLRQTLFSLAILPASLVACGGGDDGVEPPSGPHTGYVVDSVTVPDDKPFDLDGNGVKDNALGQVLGILSGQGFDVQGSLDEAVAQGTIILLYDLQTPDFTTAAGAGLSILLGDNPAPAACTDVADLVCGHHLEGDASFDIAAASPTDAGVDGKIAGGVFNGGPGNFTLQIALAGSNPISLDLIGARAKATGITADGIGEVLLAGAISEEQLNTEVLPAIHAQLGPIITEDCDAAAGPPDCGCVADSTGSTIISFFDDDADCGVTLDEIKNNGLIQSVLSPDVTIDGVDALSLTVSTTAVGASFPGIGAKPTR